MAHTAEFDIDDTGNGQNCHSWQYQQDIEEKHDEDSV
jgi:hypothetical protein